MIESGLRRHRFSPYSSQTAEHFRLQFTYSEQGP